MFIFIHQYRWNSSNVLCLILKLLRGAFKNMEMYYLKEEFSIVFNIVEDHRGTQWSFLFHYSKCKRQVGRTSFDYFCNSSQVTHPICICIDWILDMKCIFIIISDSVMFSESSRKSCTFLESSLPTFLPSFPSLLT